MALRPPFNIYLEESRTRTIEMNKSTFFLRLTTIAFVALAACSSDDSSSAEYLEQESSSSIEESSSSVEISSSSQEHYSSSSEQIFIDERDGQPYRYVFSRCLSLWPSGCAVSKKHLLDKLRWLCGHLLIYIWKRVEQGLSK